MTLERTNTTNASNKVRKENCLYLRYRHRKPPSRDEIRLLHPSIIDVRYPRQKSAKFCHLEFETKEAAVQALKQIKKNDNKDYVILYAEKRLPNCLNVSVSTNASTDENDEDSDVESDHHSEEEKSDDSEACKTKSKQPKTANSKKRKAESIETKKKSPKVTAPKDNTQPNKCLHVSGLPDLAVQQVLQNLFPAHTKIVVGDKKLNGKKFAVVHFKTTEEATRGIETSKDVRVNGNILTVKFHE